MGFGEKLLDFIDGSFGEGRRRNPAWSLVATQRSGRFSPPRGGIFNRSQAQLEAPHGEVLVRATIEHRGSENQTTWTIVTASWLLRAGPIFTVSKANLFRRVGRALGMPDLETGDELFDARFIVKSSAPEAAKVALSADVRTAMLALDAGELKSDGHTIRYEVADSLNDAHAIDAAITLVGAAANLGAFWLALLRRLPGTPSGLDGPWSFGPTASTNLDVGGTTVRVSPEPNPWGSELVVSVPLRRELAMDWVRVDIGGRLLDAPPKGLLDPAELAALQALGPVAVGVQEQRVKAVFRHDVVEEDVMKAARWVAQLAEGSRRQGAFR